MDLAIKRKWVHRIILQAQQMCHKDQPLQHPTHTSQTGEPPQAPPVNNQNIEGHQKCDHHQYTPQDYQDLLEHNGTTGPPEYLQNLVKGQDPLKGRARCWNLTLEHHQAQVLPHNLLDHLKHNSMFSMWQKWPLEQILPLLQFDVCRVTTHSTHMCRASKDGNMTARSPVCIYCG